MTQSQDCCLEAAPSTCMEQQQGVKKATGTAKLTN